MGGRIVCVVGPTACGKTTLGVALAKRYGGEVVSADSMQIYRGLTIGTAAPTGAEMDGVPHHMVAVADPAERWSAARYAQEGAELLRYDADRCAALGVELVSRPIVMVQDGYVRHHPGKLAQELILLHAERNVRIAGGRYRKE